MARWFENNGPDSDVVISSRVRLARNIRDYNFSLKLDEKSASDMIDKTMTELSGCAEFADYTGYNFKDLNEYQKHAMEERHTISRFLMEQKYAAGLVSPEEDVSVMINEEDHIRIQSFVSGRDMKSAYHKASSADDIIGRHVPYAYHEKYGYLTTCLSSVGTGMRASDRKSVV